MEPLIVNRRHCYGIYTIRVAVEVALIATGCAVPASKNKDRAFSIPAIIDAIDDGLLYKISRAFHRLTVVRRSPTTAVDRNIIETIVERSGLVYI